MDTTFSCCGENEMERNARIGQEKISTIYNMNAPVYNLWGKLTKSRARNRALELAEIVNGQSILEVAVGTGLAFSEIVQENPDGTNIGIDLSPEMLAQAKKRLRYFPGNYSVEKGSALNLNIPDASVDTILNNYMFDLIVFEDMETILMEFKRVLKKGGRLVLVNMTKGEKFGSNIYDRIYDLSPRLMGGCRGVKMKERLQEHGFRVEIREYFQQLLFPLEVVLAYKP